MKRNITQHRRIYRVECNHGSKYFANGIEAYYYFEDMLHANKGYVELWLIVKHLTPKVFSVHQELIAYRSVGGLIRPDKPPCWHN